METHLWWKHYGNPLVLQSASHHKHQPIAVFLATSLALQSSWTIKYWLTGSHLWGEVCLHVIRISILSSHISFTSELLFHIPQLLKNTSSLSLVATVHVNLQIPLLLLFILNRSCLLFYLCIPPRIFIPHSHTSQYSTCPIVLGPKIHGTVQSLNEMRFMVIAPCS